uniref:Uncharacterized protein n=1 Tax=Euplotes harpa TaxID=151035 RepID=A0A7S3NFP8_9SPIT
MISSVIHKEPISFRDALFANILKPLLLQVDMADLAKEVLPDKPGLRGELVGDPPEALISVVLDAHHLMLNLVDDLRQVPHVAEVFMAQLKRRVLLSALIYQCRPIEL